MCYRVHLYKCVENGDGLSFSTQSTEICCPTTIADGFTSTKGIGLAVKTWDMKV